MVVVERIRGDAVSTSNARRARRGGYAVASRPSTTLGSAPALVGRPPSTMPVGLPVEVERVPDNVARSIADELVARRDGRRVGGFTGRKHSQAAREAMSAKKRAWWARQKRSGG